ncbi:MAG: HslU--HslV peptidase proteolytic subunit [Deltaproteobacteria bacterium]|nr:MAG: HslU--HslV peptidase proteolytic subunit [Deltaproteobacteria bacterium]
MTARTREPDPIRATTILSLRHRGRVVIAGDGQVSMGQTILKANARKVRKIYQDRVLAGFAGAGADAITLIERFEAKLGQVSGNLRRAAVELAKDWRSDVIEPEDGVCAIGSGGNFALAAARVLVKHAADLPARAIAEEAMRAAAAICVFTNDQLTIEEIEGS